MIGHLPDEGRQILVGNCCETARTAHLTAQYVWFSAITHTRSRSVYIWGRLRHLERIRIACRRFQIARACLEGSDCWIIWIWIWICWHDEIARFSIFILIILWLWFVGRGEGVLVLMIVWVLVVIIVALWVVVICVVGLGWDDWITLRGSNYLSLMGCQVIRHATFFV